MQNISVFAQEVLVLNIRGLDAGHHGTLLNISGIPRFVICCFSVHGFLVFFAGRFLPFWDHFTGLRPVSKTDFATKRIVLSALRIVLAATYIVLAATYIVLAATYIVLAATFDDGFAH